MGRPCSPSELISKGECVILEKEVSAVEAFPPPRGDGRQMIP